MRRAEGFDERITVKQTITGWSSVALYLALTAFATRGLVEYAKGPLLPLAVLLLAGFLVTFAALPRLADSRPGRLWLAHASCLAASASVAALTLVPPANDYATGLMVLLSFRAAHAFRSKALVAWVGWMSVLVAASLIATNGFAWGLALALSSIAGCVILPGYVVVNRQIQAARAESEVLLEELREVHRRLEAHSAQAAELATLEEHDRLARKLHDSVSQMLFSINLTAGATRLLLANDPERARPQLERLHALTQGALADMRSFIAQLRPREQ